MPLSHLFLEKRNFFFVFKQYEYFVSNLKKKNLASRNHQFEVNLIFGDKKKKTFFYKAKPYFSNRKEKSYSCMTRVTSTLTPVMKQSKTKNITRNI